MPRAGSTRVWLAAVTLLAGCNDFQLNDANGPTQEGPPFTATEAAGLASDVRDELGAIARGYSVDRQLSPRVQVPVDAALLIADGSSFTRPRSCAELSDSHWSDSDDDKIPDDLTVSYDPSRCRFTSGEAVFTLGGQVQIVDPSTTTDAVRLRFNNLEQELTLQSESWVRRVNGLALLTVRPNGMVGSDSSLILRQSSGRGSTTLLKVWALSFVSGQTVELRQELPTGLLDISGSVVRTAEGRERRFNVVTTTPLVLDASCSASDHLSSGVLDLDFDRPAGGTAVRIAWKGCGAEPTVTVNPPSTGS